MEVLFLVGIAIAVGYAGGKLAELLKFPGVVGYLIAGLIFGPSFLNVFNISLLEDMRVFHGFALSLIAFIIGSEMKTATLKEMGKGMSLVILSESFVAFALVAFGVYLLTGKWYLALTFAALAPASAPAGTVAVLQESKAKGRLTNALYTVVGLDDGLAIVIFAFAIAIARLILTGEPVSFSNILTGPVLEIIGSVALGTAAGLLVGFAGRTVTGQGPVLVITLGGVLLCTGLAEQFHLSLILANLALGMVFVNLFPVVNRKAYGAVQPVSMPAYIIFFFIAGATLQVKLLPAMGLLGLVYILCRSAGLIGGAFAGATLSKQTPIIRKYLGVGILSQAGVAIGLAVLAAAEFRPLGDEGRNVAVAVVNTIAATTIVFEIIGPIGTRFAVSRAGEVGLNITEEDLIERYKVADVMQAKLPAIDTGDSLNDVIKVVSASDSYYYPVIDADDKLVGGITLHGIRNTFATQEINDWLVALDIMEPVGPTITPDVRLEEALEQGRKLDADYLPVVSSPESLRFVGLLDFRNVQRRLSTEVLEKQRKAATLSAPTAG